MNAKVQEDGTIEAAVESAGQPAAPTVTEFETLLRAPAVQVPAGETQPAAGTAVGDSPVIQADVDGKRVRIIAKDEIVLECGEASITLRRNGRIVIRGTYVETCSEGTNRIKGGQVRIN